VCHCHSAGAPVDSVAPGTEEGTLGATHSPARPLPGDHAPLHAHMPHSPQSVVSRCAIGRALTAQCAIDAVSGGGDARIESPVGKDWPGLVRAWWRNSAINSALPSP